MKLGKLRVVENQEADGRSSKHYHHILVCSSRGLETLIITDRELESIRSRSSKNTEEIAKTSLFDKALSWLMSFFS